MSPAPRFLRSLFTLLLVAVFTSAQPVSAAPGDMLDSNRVGDQIQKMRDAMNEAIRAAGEEARYTMMVGFQRLDVTLQSLQLIYADSLNKTFAELDKQEQRTFQDLQNTIYRSIDAINGPVGGLNASVRDASALIGNLTVTQPLVTAYSPANISSNPMSKMVAVKVSGFKLCTGDGENFAKLVIGSHEITTKQNGECINNQLTFAVPKSVFRGEPGDDLQVTAHLHIPYKVSRMLVFGSKTKMAHYTLTFNMLPETVGKVTVRSTMQVPRPVDRIPQTYTSPWVSSHAGSSGNAQFCTPLLDLRDGFRYDYAKATTWVEKSCSQKTGEVRFTLQSDNQICIQIIAKITAKEQDACARGFIQADRITLNPGTAVQSLPPQQLELRWNTDARIELPEGAQPRSITIELFDGTTKELNAANVTRLRYVEVEPNTRSGMIFFRPRTDF